MSRADDNHETKLVVGSLELAEKLAGRIAYGEQFLKEKIAGPDDLQSLRERYQTWSEYNTTLLRKSFTTSSVVDDYTAMAPSSRYSGETLASKYESTATNIRKSVRRLRSILEQLPLYSEITVPEHPPTRPEDSGARVFIVHGRDDATKQTVARFVRQVTGDDPIILHEQANAGRTTIEKFEEWAPEIGFAIVLLTGDDEGGLRGSGSRELRARQNVVLELGFLMAKLGRKGVAILYEADVELPSDIGGLLYTSLKGDWRIELAREMRAAGLSLDLNQVLI